ncbi:MAG: hypothetical protein WDZ52_06805 [Pseudohongiellaceae bacterium]
MAKNLELQPLLRMLSACLLSGLAAFGYAQQPSNPLATFIDTNARQDLTLFEGVETDENRARASGQPAREARATTAAPEFTLIGVSRIGARYSALLRHKDGTELRVRADSASNTQIPEHSGYTIVGVSADSVSISYPGDNACIEFSDRGVSCHSSGNIAELVLANGEPLAARNPARQGAGTAAADTAQQIIEARADPANPFEALRNARRNESAADGAAVSADGANARFTPRRIDPAEVPDGYRVVATPFGDRLVEQ